MLGQSLLKGHFVYNIFHLAILNYLLCFYFLVSFFKSSHSFGHPRYNFQHVLCGFIGCIIVIFINWKNCMLFSTQFLWITCHYVYYSHCFAIHLIILLTIYISFFWLLDFPIILLIIFTILHFVLIVPSFSSLFILLSPLPYLLVPSPPHLFLTLLVKDLKDPLMSFIQGDNQCFT